MNHLPTDLIESTFTRDTRSVKTLKRKFVHQARAVVLALPTDPKLDVADVRRFLVRNRIFSEGITALWFLGFWPEQIAEFVHPTVTETIVLGALRRIFALEQTNLIASFVQLLGDNL
jgi:hypothetical protein